MADGGLTEGAQGEEKGRPVMGSGLGRDAERQLDLDEKVRSPQHRQALMDFSAGKISEEQLNKILGTNR